MYAYTVLMLYFITNRESGSTKVDKKLMTFSSREKAIKFTNRNKILKTHADAEYDKNKKSIYLLTEETNVELNFYFYKTVVR